ncbi:sensor histidine kinase [Chitinophaga tropicalis]|uniref:histidine kinase n=1 Tax=Chitinophaga tropicalis TaxID=2683588 RepID=A0A7K1U2A5_9BACT|nr:PAS domain S-box protein [Chitinophaga tropicalis]MVT08489.1 PAS domain S-box protein [Chitinophaga tropicalis]
MTGENFVGDIDMSASFTDHKKEEEQLAKLAAIVQSSEDAIVSKTLTGIVTSWNNAAERMFGYTAEEMIGQPITRIIPAERLEEEPIILGKIARGERVEHFETKRVRKDGILLDISLTISPVKDRSGNIIGVSKIARNITEQKKAAMQIREREELFRMAVESTRLGSWEYSLSTQRFVWSEESRNIWGLPADLLIDRHLLENMIHPEDRDHLLTYIRQALIDADGSNYMIEFRISRFLDGELCWIKLQGKCFYGSGNYESRFIGTMLDITEEKQAKEEMEKTIRQRTQELLKINERLEKSNLALEQFAYIASHDLQEPLRKIRTFSELIREHLDDPQKVEHYFSKISASAERMSRLITGILNYSRLSQLDPFQKTDLGNVLKSVLQEYDLLIEQKNAVVKCGQLPAIMGIRSQLEQLFRNLIGNSLKFCNKAPEINITAAIATPESLPASLQPSSQKFTAITLQDNGIGFEQRYAEQIFHIFKRLDTGSQYVGTGIGLALCKKIVENHMGAITALGRKGEGAIFVIYLPCT